MATIAAFSPISTATSFAAGPEDDAMSRLIEAMGGSLDKGQLLVIL
jgi:hypothetical protein